MRVWLFLLVMLLVLTGCKEEQAQVEIRPVRAIMVDPKLIDDGRQAVGEVRPRYESDLSFRVAGKVLARLVDVGAVVKQGDTLATLDTQDYQNRLRSAEADVAACEATLIEAQAAEARLAKLLKDGFTPRANYDTALRNLRSAEAKLAAAKANVELTGDQLRYTELKAEFDGVVTAVGAEVGQNVASGQMVVKLARPDEKDGVFTVAEAALTDLRDERSEVTVWPLSNPDLVIDGVMREISPVADATTRTFTVKVTLKLPPPQIRFGMSIGGRWTTNTTPVVALPLSALFDRSGSPAVWVFDPQAGRVTLRAVTVARYEANSAVISDGLAKGDIVVVAGINTLREGQAVRLADASLDRSASR